MKPSRKTAACILSGLILGSGAYALAPDLSDNPYAAIAARNVFGLKPPAAQQTPEELAASQKPPPPKIVFNGRLMSIFGKEQVLFKVSVPAKPPEPAKDVPYILSEGQSQDEIEVQVIDEKAETVTFNNHGTIQVLALNKDAAKTPITAGAPVGGPPSTIPTIPPPNMPNYGAPKPGVGGGGSGVVNFGSSVPANPNFGSSSQGGGQNAGSGGIPSRMVRSSQQNQQGQEIPQMSAEEQAIRMKIFEKANADKIRRGELPPLPQLPGLPDMTQENPAP